MEIFFGNQLRLSIAASGQGEGASPRGFSSPHDPVPRLRITGQRYSLPSGPSDPRSAHCRRLNLGLGCGLYWGRGLYRVVASAGFLRALSRCRALRSAYGYAPSGSSAGADRQR
jgi:hypothetical protein